MKKKIIFPFLAIILSSCSSGFLSDNLNKDDKKDGQFFSFNDYLSLNNLPGIYDEGFDLKFKYDEAKYKLYYTFDSNHILEKSYYFEYGNEVIKMYEAKKGTISDYPCTTSVDAILPYDNEGKCVSNNYIYNIQKTGNYKLSPKQSTVSVILEDKETGEMVMNKSFTYIIEKGAKEKYTLPIVSISLNYDDIFDPLEGFYNNIRSDFEKRCSLEFIDPYYSEYFNINSQIKLGGNWTLGYPLRTLNMNFNKDENKKKNSPITDHIFKDRNTVGTNQRLTKFTRFRVHSGGNAFEESIGFNDALLQRIMEGSKASTAASRPVITYINDEYWGLMFIREHYKTSYFEQNYGVNKDDVVMYDLKGSLAFDDGDEEELGIAKINAMNEFLNAKDFTSNANYEEFINNYVDIDSFIDTILAHGFASNWDFIGNFNNLKAWAVVKNDDSNPYADGKIRFCIHDCDFAFRDTTNVFDKNYNFKYQKFPLLDKLMDNASFRTSLLNRAKELVDSNFKYEKTSKILEDYVKEIANFKPDSAYRWGQSINYKENWVYELSNVKNNLKNKASVFLSEIEEFTKSH